MIVQQLLDWLSQAAAGLLNLIPPLPPEVQSAVANVQSALASVGSWIEPLGVVIPFAAFNAIVAGVLVLFAFWLVMIPLRVVWTRLTGRS